MIEVMDQLSSTVLDSFVHVAHSDSVSGDTACVYVLYALLFYNNIVVSLYTLCV